MSFGHFFLRNVFAWSLVLGGFAAASGCAAAPDDEGTESSEDAVTLKGAAKSVLVLPLPYESNGKPNSDHWSFQEGAKKLATVYASRGAAVVRPKATELTSDPASLFTYLTDLKNAKKRFDRVIVLGHGGADGPLWGAGLAQIGHDWPIYVSRGDDLVQKQRDIDANFAKFVELGALLAALTTDDALIYLGQCRPGQPTTWDSGGRTFIEALACVTGRQTAGRKGSTSATDAVEIVLRLEAGDVPSASNFTYANDGRVKCTSLPRPIAKADPTAGVDTRPR